MVVDEHPAIVADILALSALFCELAHLYLGQVAANRLLHELGVIGGFCVGRRLSGGQLRGSVERGHGGNRRKRAEPRTGCMKSHRSSLKEWKAGTSGRRKRRTKVTRG